MLKFRKFLSRTVLVIGVLVGASLPTYFSYAQNFGPSDEDLGAKSFNFRMPGYLLYLYTHTSPNPYIISFDGNGHTAGSMENIDMLYDKRESLPANNFTRDGYQFLGWSETSEGPVVYSDQSEVERLTTTYGGVVKLYAQREAEVPYTVEYFLQKVDGSGYDSAGTGTEYGKQGTGVLLTGKVFTGFELQTGAEITIISGGTVPVPYYYTRKEYNLVIYDRGEFPILDTGVKYGADLTAILPELTWTGNSLSGWNNRPEDGLMPANDLELTSVWTYGEHSITFDTEDGTEIPPITGNYGDPITPPPAPTKDGYIFKGWDPAIPETMPYDDIVIKAIWQAVQEESTSGWSGGGRRKTPSDESEGEHGAANAQPADSINKNRTSMEVMIAYMWAHSRGVTEKLRKDSDPDGYVTRGDMAKMVVKFTENVMGKSITYIPDYCDWGDTEREWNSLEAKIYAQKSCALGVMGIRVQNFMPNKILDRAEFGTVLSRLLWGDKYDVVDATSTKPYYTRHLAALQREGVMTQIDNPLNRKELRKWAWLMLMRVESKVLR